MCNILFISLLFDAEIAIATECWNANPPFTDKIRQHFRSSQYKKQISLWTKPAHRIVHHTSTSGTQLSDMELRRNNYQITVFSLGSSICLRRLSTVCPLSVCFCCTFLLFISFFFIKLTLGVTTLVLRSILVCQDMRNTWAFFLVYSKEHFPDFYVQNVHRIFYFQNLCLFLECRCDLPLSEKIRKQTFNLLNFMSTVDRSFHTVSPGAGMKAFIR